MHEASSFDEADGLYGREDEQAMLDQRLAAFEQGRGTVLSIVGEAGLARRAWSTTCGARPSGAGSNACAAVPGRSKSPSPYAAWRPVFGHLLNVREERRRQRPGNDAPDWARSSIRSLPPLVNAVVPGFPRRNGRSCRASPDRHARMPRPRCSSEVLEAHATRRFVLVLEDCHWMDSASWRLLLRVAQDFPQALIVSDLATDHRGSGSDTLRTLARLHRDEAGAVAPDAIALLRRVGARRTPDVSRADRRDRAALGGQPAVRAGVCAAADLARGSARSNGLLPGPRRGVDRRRRTSDGAEPDCQPSRRAYRRPRISPSRPRASLATGSASI